jgi:hypothetical protein
LNRKAAFARPRLALQRRRRRGPRAAPRSAGVIGRSPVRWPEGTGNDADPPACLAHILAKAAGSSKAVTFVPRRKRRPVLTQIRKNYRIVGADNLDPHEHVAVEPDLAREVSAQRVGEFVMLGLMGHAINSQDFGA